MQLDRVKDAERAVALGIDLVEYKPSADPHIPLSYVVRVDVGQDQPLTLEYFYVTKDEQIPHMMEWAGYLKALGYDLETSGLDAMDDKVATMQLGHPRETPVGLLPRVYVIDVRCVSSEALAPVRALLADKKVVKYGANLKFEAKFSQAQLKAKIRGLLDTQVTEQVLRTGLLSSKKEGAASEERGGADRSAYKHTSMDALARRYLGIVLDKDKDLRTSFYRTPPGQHNLRQIVYAGGDTVYPYFIAQKQRQEIEARKLKSVVRIEMGVIPVLADMELTGFRIDQAQWNKLWQEAVKNRAEAERALDKLLLGHQGDLFGGANKDVRPLYHGTKTKPVPVNYSSPAQVKWVLKQYCKAIGWKHQLVTTVAELQKLKRRAEQPWQPGEPEWVGEARTWLEQHKGKLAADIPDYILPEAQFAIVLSANKDTLILRKCRGQLPAEIVDLLIAYSKADIRCDTFGKDFLNKHVRRATGCIHTEFHQCLTRTGRLSSSPNLQNIPADQRYRHCFIPHAGYKFVICDYSQIEPRISAQCSKDPVYLSVFFDPNGDLYVAVAEAMLGYKVDIHSDDPAVKAQAKLERKIFKTVVLALAYNMGKWKLRDRLTLALHDEIMAGKVEPPTFAYAAELWDKFFEVHSKIRDLQLRNIEDAVPLIVNKQTNEAKPNPRRIWDDFLQAEVTWVTAPCGRKRFFPPDAKNTYTEAPNVPPQSGSATITKAAAVMIQDEIDVNGWDAHLVNLVHDEIVCMVRDDQAEAFAPIMKGLMEKAGQFYCPDVPIGASYPEGSTTGVVTWWAKEFDEEEEALAAAA